MFWILKCGNFHSGELLGFHNLRSMVSRYFFDIDRYLKPVRMPYGWISVPATLTKHKCYFLGTWPFFWNTKSHLIVYAHDQHSWDARTQGSKPEIPGVTLADSETKALNSVPEDFGEQNMTNYYYPERLSGDYRSKYAKELEFIKGMIDKDLDPLNFSLGKDNVENYIKSKMQLDAMLKRYKNCINLKYPPQQKKTSTYTPTEKPMRELTLPEIDYIPPPPEPTTPGGPPAPKAERITLTFGIKLTSLVYTHTLSASMFTFP